MAKDIKRHLSHLKSSGETSPLASDLLYGEIAVGYKKGKERFYIKNNSDEIVDFQSTAQVKEMTELYTDRHVISKVTGDSEISVSLNAIEGNTTHSGRTLTITHSAGSSQSGFKKLDSDSYGHITGGSNVTLADLTGLGAVSGVTGEQGITASTRASGNQKIGHSNKITAGTAKGSSGAISHQGNIDIPSITYDSNGHVTSTGKTTVTLPENDNYISGVTASNSGISLSVTNRVLKAGHENTITAGSAKTTSSSVTSTPTGNNIAIPVIEYNVHGHITKTGTTNVSLKVNSATTSTEGVVKLATATGTNNTNVVMTQKAVTDAINDSFTAQDAMRYKGTLTAKTQFESITNYNVGDTYKIASAFTTTAGVKLEVGDMVIAQASGTTFNASNFNYIQANLDPTTYAVKTTKISAGDALSGGGDLSADRTISHKALAPSGAAGTTSPSAAQTPNFNETFNIPVINYDKYGHITGTTTATVKIPNSGSTWTYYTTGLTVTTATTSNTITLSGTNAAVKGTAILSGATQSAAGLMSKDDKTKLDGVATGAEVNQNAFSNVKVGSTTIAADGKTDTLELSAATFVTLTPDATNDKVTIGVSTGTSNSTLARGDHNHDSVYALRTTKISTASGLTGGGDLTSNRTIGLVATGTSGTYGPTANVTGTEGTTIKVPQITTDVYGRVTSVTERTLTNKDTTYTFDGTYNASSNKAATVSSVTSRISAISGSSTGSTSKTITAISQSNGVVTPTYANISITKSQVSDFPTSMIPTAHNQASNTITAMTSYSKASASGAVSTSDSLNTAIGKIEKRTELIETALGGLKFVKLTTAQYEALSAKDPNTLYIISD